MSLPLNSLTTGCMAAVTIKTRAHHARSSKGQHVSRVGIITPSPLSALNTKSPSRPTPPSPSTINKTTRDATRPVSRRSSFTSTEACPASPKINARCVFTRGRYQSIPALSDKPCARSGIGSRICRGEPIKQRVLSTPSPPGRNRLLLQLMENLGKRGYATHEKHGTSNGSWQIMRREK